jgi:hypothetical protein
MTPDEKKQHYMKKFLKDTKELEKFKEGLVKELHNTTPYTKEQLAEMMAEHTILKEELNANAKKRGFKNAENEFAAEEKKRNNERKADILRREQRQKELEQEREEEEKRRKQKQNQNKKAQENYNKRMNSLAEQFGYKTRKNLLNNAGPQRGRWRSENPKANYMNLESFIKSKHFVSSATRKQREEANRQRRANEMTRKRKEEQKRLQNEANRKRKEEENRRRREEEEEANFENAETLSYHTEELNRNSNSNSNQLSVYEEPPIQNVSPDELIHMIPHCKSLFTTGYVSRRNQDKCYKMMDQMRLRLANTYGGGTRKVKNRANELQRVKSELTNKQQFRLKLPKTVIPGQMIQLFSSVLQDDFQGIQLKESNPKEYLKQKQKIQAKKNLDTRKYNKPKRGPGSRGSKSSENALAWMKRLGW